MNHQVFFAAIRPAFGGSLTEKQVEGINAILTAWEKYGDGNYQKLAYILATAKWETAHTMQPIYERGAKAYFNKYEPNTPIGKRLGNTLTGDGYKYRGRGFVQLTGRRNYSYAGTQLTLDLLVNPDKALDPAVAARILVVGTLDGWFTGKGLGNYIDDVDEGDDEDLKEFVAARRTVNGTDKATVIGEMALQFEKALEKAKLAHPAPDPTPMKEAKKDWLTVLIEFLLGLFKRK